MIQTIVIYGFAYHVARWNQHCLTRQEYGMEAAHVPVIFLGCGAEVAKLTV
jgi:hypothetical protein